MTMSDAAKVLDWNGRDFPEALRDLPPGHYLLERVETAAEAGLTPEQEDGVIHALEQADRGETTPWEVVRARLAGRIGATRAG
jgi:hypothetical protein